MLRNLNQSISGRGRICGTPKSGVKGQLIPSIGTNGPAYTYNDLTLPDDNDKEIRGFILTFPEDGNLVAYEDTSFSFTSANDGTYYFQYQLYEDGLAIGEPATVTLQVGTASNNITTIVGNSTAAGATSSIYTATTINCFTGGSVADGKSASLNGSISCSTGSSIGTGHPAYINLTIGCSVGESQALGLLSNLSSGEGTNASISVSGVSAISYLGNVSTIASSNAIVSGIRAAMYLGTVGNSYVSYAPVQGIYCHISVGAAVSKVRDQKSSFSRTFNNIILQ